MLEQPTGERFALTYLRSGEPIPDSQRMRLRLATLLNEQEAKTTLADFMERELGVRIRRGYDGPLWDRFCREAELRDILDSITVVFKVSVLSNRGAAARVWREEVRRVFHEEHVSYFVDDKCGVHFLVDAAFAAVRASALAALTGSRYDNVRQQFERAHLEMDHAPPNGKEAIRGVFAAVEGLYRLMFPNAHRLGSAQISQQLAPLIGDVASGPTAVNSSQKLLIAFKGWVEAAHFYRHEPGSEEPAQPPVTLAIVLVDQGGSFLRWLAELDRERQVAER